MKLKDTIDLMTSEDYQERFKAEYYQLKLRTEKLSNLLEKADRNELDFQLKCSKNVLGKQLGYMLNYLNTLELRARLEQIDLTEKGEE